MNWTPNKNTSGETLNFGIFQIGKYFWNSVRPRGDENVYKVVCTLPGINNDLGSFPTEQQAKERLESVAVNWIKLAGLQIK